MVLFYLERYFESQSDIKNKCTYAFNSLMADLFVCDTTTLCQLKPNLQHEYTDLVSASAF